MAKRTRSTTVSAGTETVRSVVDGLSNIVSGMGGESDKAMAARFNLLMVDRGQLDSAYRGDWISRKGIDIPAFDTFREWRTWQADKDDINKIEQAEQDNRIQLKAMKAMVYGRLYGGGALLLGVDQGKPEDPLEVEQVGEGDLKFVHALSRFDLSCGQIDWDITSPWYGRPLWYSPAQRGIDAAKDIKLHPSRVVVFKGNEIPDPNQATDGWGDSVLQSTMDAIIGAGSTTSSIAQLVAEAKIDVINIPGLSENITNSVYENRLKKRFSFANMAKSVYKMLLLDKEETWNRIESNFAGLPDVLKLYLLIGSAAFDVPATRFLSQSPAGLNATGDSDTRNYYDRVSTEQKVFVSPNLDILDKVLIRSALGAVPDDEYREMYYQWNPLWQLDEQQKSTIVTQKANSFKIDVDAGLMNEVVLKKAREAQLIADGTYPGLQQIIDDYDDDPDLVAKQAEEAAAAEQMAALGGVPPTNPDGTPNPNANAANSNTPPPAKGANSNEPVPPKKAQPPKKAGAKGSQSAAVDAIVRRLSDASTPRSLYVRRDVLNQADIIRWAKSQGFKSAITDMHVTIIYSKSPVDWLKAGSDDWGGSGDADGNLLVKPGGPRVIERFGSAVVLGFANSDLSYRHRSIMGRCEDDGISWDYDDYTPHVTITYDAGDVNLENVKPYQGEIKLGPEIFEEVKTQSVTNNLEEEST